MEKTEKNIVIPEHILGLMKKIEQNGEEVYIVGGSLRDILLGNIPNDYDLATSALPEKTKKIFSDHRVITTGIKHGTVTVMEEGEPIEITTFRIDGKYSDSRHPDGVTFTKRIEEDLSRRDFTVNAMAYHPAVGLVDPFGGQKDLKEKILRTVGESERRFDEDALRILRAFRFSAQLGFEIEEKTLFGCYNSKFGLTKVAKERISTEFLRLLLSQNPAPSLKKMIETKVSSFVFGDYIPSDRLLEKIFSIPSVDTARLGLFFAECEEEQVKEILENLKYSKKQITGACAVVRGAKQKILTPADARRLSGSCGIYAEHACLASILLQNSPEKSMDWVKNQGAATKISDLKISGNDLLALGFSGIEIGTILKDLLGLVMEDPALNEKKILLEIVEKKYRS